METKREKEKTKKEKGFRTRRTDKVLLLLLLLQKSRVCQMQIMIMSLSDPEFVRCSSCSYKRRIHLDRVQKYRVQAPVVLRV
jgi:hypothetical protein